jgi:molecular chaperone DnaK (HSP70)
VLQSGRYSFSFALFGMLWFWRQVQVACDVDANGTITIAAADPISGATSQLVIAHKDHALTAAEIAQMVEQANHWLEHDRVRVLPGRL